jgi:hypothetical protein
MTPRQPANDDRFFAEGLDSVRRLVRPRAGPIPPAAADVLISFEVDAVHTVHARAAQSGVPFELSLRNEAIGQRHFTTADADRRAVDVIQLIPH